MADNIQLSTNVGTGDVLRTLDDGTAKWPAGLSAYPTTIGTPDVVQLVDLTHGLPVQPQTGATFPVSLASSVAVTNAGVFAVQVDALPAGLATSALQSAQGVLLTSIDSRLAGTLAVSDGGGSLTVDGTVAVSGSVAVTGTFWQATQPVSIASLPALAAGTNAIGKLAANSGVTVGAVEIAAAQTLATVTTVGTVTSLTQMNGQAVAMGTGVRSAGTQRVTIATDDVVPASQSGTWTVQPGNTANTTPWLTSDRPATTGGLDMSKTVSAASTNATVVKASAGQVYDLQVFNTNAAARYLKLYNKATSPTVGTDVPVKTILIPGNTAGAGVVKEWAKGLAFSAGIAFALTTGVADADTGAVAASEIVVNLDYK